MVRRAAFRAARPLTSNPWREGALQWRPSAAPERCASGIALLEGTHVVLGCATRGMDMENKIDAMMVFVHHDLLRDDEALSARLRRSPHTPGPCLRQSPKGGSTDEVSGRGEESRFPDN